MYLEYHILSQVVYRKTNEKESGSRRRRHRGGKGPDRLERLSDSHYPNTIPLFSSSIKFFFLGRSPNQGSKGPSSHVTSQTQNIKSETVIDRHTGTRWVNRKNPVVKEKT